MTRLRPASPKSKSSAPMRWRRASTSAACSSFRLSAFWPPAPITLSTIADSSPPISAPWARKCPRSTAKATTLRRNGWRKRRSKAARDIRSRGNGEILNFKFKIRNLKSSFSLLRRISGFLVCRGFEHRLLFVACLCGGKERLQFTIKRQGKRDSADGEIAMHRQGLSAELHFLPVRGEIDGDRLDLGHGVRLYTGGGRGFPVGQHPLPVLEKERGSSARGARGG